MPGGPSCWMGTSEWEGRTTKRSSLVLSVREMGAGKGVMDGCWVGSVHGIQQQAGVGVLLVCSAGGVEFIL